MSQRASVNIRRGIRRLAIAICVPWFAWWALVAWSAYQTHRYYDAHYDRSAPWDDSKNLALMKMENRASDDTGKAILYGLFLPAGLLIVGLIGWWVYRGFTGKREDGPNKD